MKKRAPAVATAEPSAELLPAAPAGQLAALDALITGASVERAAALAQLPPAELLALLDAAPVVAYLNKRRRILHSAQVERLRALRGRALDTLADILDKRDAPALQLQAAALLLRFGAELNPPGGPETPHAVEAQRRYDESMAELTREF